MELKNFDEMIRGVREASKQKRIAVAAAEDKHTLEAVLQCAHEGVVHPLLIGNRTKILAALEELGGRVQEEQIVDSESQEDSAAKAVALVRSGKAELLMKGGLDTAILMRAVVHKELGLRKQGLISHFAIYEIPGLRKLLTVVDCGMVPYPTLIQKKQILENTVRYLHSMGYECPKVAVLACIEKVNPNMPETVEADQLKQMNRSGGIAGCLVEGPISYDCAMDPEIARIKGYESPVTGDCDVLLVPNIHAGNILAKALTVTCKARMAGVVAGARCPIVVTSRGSSADEKRMSILLASAVNAQMRE